MSPFHSWARSTSPEASRILPVVIGIDFDILLAGDQQLLGFLQLLRLDGVKGVTEIFERRTDNIAGIAEKRDAAGIFRLVEHDFPAIDRLLNLALAVAYAECSPHVRHRMLAAGIEGRVLERRVDVRHVGDFGVVERDHHAGDDHAFQIVVGGHDDIITGIAFLELGEELVIVGKEIHLHLDARRFLEIGKGGFTDVGIPIVEIELFFLLGARQARHKGQAGSECT